MLSFTVHVCGCTGTTLNTVALLIIDAIDFKLYVRKFVDAFRFVVLYCIVVYFFLFFFFYHLVMK